MNKYSLVIISGPTASYKSHIADTLYAECKSVIINADSMQVYKEIPTLTAQPKDLYNKDKYELYSIFNYNEYCSVGKWVSLAHAKIAYAHSKGKLPIIVGGTGLYLKALINGLSDIPNISDEIRNNTRALFETLGKERFYQALREKDIDCAVNPNDSQRMIRAMEVFEQTGQSIKSFSAHKQENLYSNFLHLSLSPDRKLLYENCNKRFGKMVLSGVLQEVEELISKVGESTEHLITKAIGFRELRDYLIGKSTLDDAKNLAKQFTRNYAKRQMTWFRNQMQEKSMIEFSSLNELDAQVEQIIANHK